MLIKDSITETQDVNFILDSSKDFDLLDDIDLTGYEKAIVICDDSLKDDWWPKLEKKLKVEIKHVEFMEAVEASKDVGSYAKLVDVLSDNGCSRDDLIIGVGGGIVLDVVSFLASTYMRGIDLMMIPTTLIGQADASTAGKTCLNTKAAKNLLGTLYLPKFVYNNVTLLSTNSDYHMRQGFSEIFKYALLGSNELLELLLDYNKDPDDSTMLKILEETIKVRLFTRKKHPLASNFGHTFGHAFEKYSDFAVNHGDAIAVGMLMALDFSVEKGLIDARLRDKVCDMMQELGLNTKVESGMDVDKIVELMLKDKKSSGSEIRLVLIEDIAKPYEKDGNRFYPVEPEVMKEFLTKALVSYSEQGWWKKLKE